MNEAIQLLRNSGLRRTAAREAILRLLAAAGRPLSHQDLLNKQKGTASLDRVTVYRTLVTLQEAGLIHRIQGIDGTWRYCRHRHESPGACAGGHIHFLCSRCNRMTCMPEQPLPWVSAPAGARILSKQLVVHGLCSACLSKEKADDGNR